MISASRKYFFIFLQVALWVFFLALPYLTVPHAGDENNVDNFIRHATPPADMARNMFLGSLVFNICIISFFYLHHYLIYDRLFASKKYVQYIIMLLVSFLTIFYGSRIFRRFIFESFTFMMHPAGFRDLVKAVTWFLLVLLISLGIKLLSRLKETEERAREIENAQLRTELSFLHAQINPHFLFNSLNTIYSLALKKSDSAPAAILKLSHLLRYVIDDANRESVPLEQEVNYLNNYIELQKLRSTSSLAVTFNVNGNISSAQIVPLLLLPFVENAFKYGISNHESSPIDIDLTIAQERMNFSVKNRKFEHAELDSTGIGINNVKRRLELLYPGKYELTIQDKDEFYFIKLIIQFT